MSNFSTKIRLLYYKGVLDVCLRMFFREYGDLCFTKSPKGGYVFSGSWPKVEKWFDEQVRAEILSTVRPFDVTSPEYTFIIGGCVPSDNMLLDHVSGYFPAKLSAALKMEPCPKYVLRETGIAFDMLKFSEMTDDLFCQFFEKGFEYDFGRGYRNVFALRHRRLDCYAVFKIMKYVYGKSACVNVWKERFSDVKPCMTAVNDLIDLYVNNKCEMNRSPEFKTAVEEIRQYTEMRIRSV